MFQAHGWIELEDGPRSDKFGDPETTPTQDTLDRIRDLVRTHGLAEDADLVIRNGVAVLQILSCHNHFHRGLRPLLAAVGEVAPGSFGMVHVWDDESSQPNEWVAFSVVRGELLEAVEERLSPVVPKLMDD
jgi:hypothetical protein